MWSVSRVGELAIRLGNSIKSGLGEVAVQSLTEGHLSSVLATISSFLGIGPMAVPVPLGPGMRCPSTKPQWPVIMHGTVWCCRSCSPSSLTTQVYGKLVRDHDPTDGNLFEPFNT